MASLCNLELNPQEVIGGLDSAEHCSPYLAASSQQY